MAIEAAPRTTRCKMACRVAEQSEYGGTRVVLGPVYDADPHSVNHSFWQATPAGQIDLTITNPAGAAVFQVGKEYYVDFQEAT